MARRYPRFIYSDPRNTKSVGPFIVHTLPPQLIAKVTFNEDGFHQLAPLSVFTAAGEQEVNEVIYRMHDWFTAQRMEEAKLSPDFYIRISDISRQISQFQFFGHVSTSITYKPVMGAKMEVGTNEWKVEVAFANGDTYNSAVKKLKDEYHRKYGLLPDWPLLIRP
jgi:hypothetical protein